ncbi:unnamed protein product [Medioppia subpectinata]|uniref:RNA helicase n=1 Tax=Medioppia subpectinata TaxID=1979941 RepID=A0A7R9KL73_9ACAR|nr:unnamed protein product [Medioppia subpectinata]CAG2105644.1 unnamed protein product [Medioppia subpectinata]
MFVKTNKTHICLTIALNVRKLSSIGQSLQSLPVIKIPKYLKTSLSAVRHNEHKRADQIVKEDKQLNDSSLNDHKFDPNVCVISTTNQRLNHFLGQKYKCLDKIPLVSKEWINGNNTNGQSMRFHVHEDNPSIVVKESPQHLSATFRSLGLKSVVCDAIESMDIKSPTGIQMAAIPSILDKKNVICSAETGSGKTMVYLAPIIQMIRQFKEYNSQQTSQYYPKGLVIVPSRELAEQVGRVAQHLATYCGIGVAVMMGGPPQHISHTGMDLIISTIGLVQPLIQKRIYSIRRLNHLVIDESDTLFDDTFGGEVIDLLGSVLVRDNTHEANDESDNEESRLESTPGGLQLVCVSATMPRNLNHTLGKIVDIDDNFDIISTHGLHHIMPHVQQNFHRIHKFERQYKLLELVKKDVRIGKPVMVFSNRSDSSNWIYHYLNDNGVHCLRLNSEISDKERYDQLKRFQSGDCNVISCTDLGSRGLDTVGVRHVINYDCPHYVSDYIHRSGRTGRMGSKQDCLVSTFVSFKPDVMMVKKLELALRLNRPIDSVDANIKHQMNVKMKTVNNSKEMRAKRKQ